MKKKTPSSPTNLKSKNSKPQFLQVLIVEDSEDDMLLIIRELKKGGYNTAYERVETAVAMKKALKEKQWDIILCDYKLPQFSGTKAIALLKEINIDIPVIIVSGTIGEETAIECMRLGAHDYIMKNNLSRLCVAIARELDEANSRSKRKQAEEALRQSEERYRTILDEMEDGYFEVDLAGKFTFVNDADCRLLGHSREELIGASFKGHLNEEDFEILYNAFGRIYSTGKPERGISYRAIRKDGITGFAEVAGFPLQNQKGEIIGFRGIAQDITVRKQMEEVLRQSEEKYRTILENIEDGYYEVDLNGNFTFFNASMCRILGYPQEEMMGMNNRQFTDKENAKKLFKTFNEVYKTGEPAKEFDWQIIRKDGTKRHIEVSVSLQNNSSGQPIGFRGVARDISERKQAEEAQRESEEKYRELVKNAPAGIYEVDYETNLFTRVNDVICEYTGYTRDELLTMNLFTLLTEESQKLMLARLEKLMDGEKIPQTIEYCIRTKGGEELWVFLNARYIYEAGKLKGATGVIYNITDRRKAEEALRESESKYRLLADNVNDVIFVLDMDLNYTYISPSVKILRGYEPAELLKLSSTETLTPSSWDLAMRTISEVMELEKSEHREIHISRTLQLEMRRKDGTNVWTEAKLSFIRDENQRPVGILGVTRDITERRRAEQTLRESEEKYRNILENMQEGYFELDLAGNYTFANDAECRNIGYPKEELIGMNFRQYTDEENAKILYQPYYELYQTGKSIETLEVESIRKDGTKVIYETSASLIRDTEGKPIGFRGLSRDITERKFAENALRQSEEKYRTILENIDDGYYEIDLNGNFTFFNDSACRIFGYPQEEMMGMNNRQYTDKENLKKVFSAFNGVYKTGVPTKEFAWQTIRKDGTKRFLESSISLQKDSSGKPIGFRGVIHDVTERKQAEEELRKSEERYRTILEDIDEGYFENDLAGNLTFVNDAECRDLGYSREELIGMNYRQYSDEATVKNLYELFHNIYNTGKPVKRFSGQFISKDGVRHFNEVSASLIRDAKDKPIGFRGIAQDITERKRTEKERQQSFERMRKALRATVQSISMIVEMKDPYTSGHQQRVADLARSIATEMGLSADRQDFIRTASAIHDIGKISIPSEILSKPTKLTDLEFNLIKTHSQSGYDILKDIEFPWPVADVVLQHHERMNGSGYPQGLKGDDILLEARILAVADVVEALASHRPYRPALGIDLALKEIAGNKGILYDADAADACLKLFQEKGYTLVFKK